MTNTPKTLLFSWKIRIYYEDTDLAGVVYYANYLKFYERARTEWLRHLGLENGVLKAQEQLVFVVTQCHLSYVAPGQIDDQVIVTVDSCDAKRASAEVIQSIYRLKDHQLLNRASISFASVDAQTYKPRRLPLVFSTLNYSPS